MGPLGNVTLLHLTDSHATLRPIFFREPDTLIGIGDERGKPPYLTGPAFLRFYGLSARRYKVTGWASLGEADGPAAWDVVAAHLRSLKRVKIDPRPRVRVLS